MSGNTNILLVEDDRHIALALQIRLSAAGYCVQLAASVAEALDQVNRQVPEVAVIDVNLPDGDGIALMKSLGAPGHAFPVVSIIMSASRRQGLREEALAAGAYTFLEKPFPSTVLMEAVECCSSIKRAC